MFPSNTSQDCSSGVVGMPKPPSERTHLCPACVPAIVRDRNTNAKFRSGGRSLIAPDAGYEPLETQRKRQRRDRSRIPYRCNSPGLESDARTAEAGQCGVPDDLYVLWLGAATIQV